MRSSPAPPPFRIGWPCQNHRACYQCQISLLLSYLPVLSFSYAAAHGTARSADSSVVCRLMPDLLIGFYSNLGGVIGNGIVSLVLVLIF